MVPSNPLDRRDFFWDSGKILDFKTGGDQDCKRVCPGSLVWR
jgi:hypothetical protein